VKTRTLLLLSVATGLAILLAGGVLLLQLAGQEPTADLTPLGEPVSIGDATVVVESSTGSTDTLTVTLTAGGVADDDWQGDVRLVTGDRRLEPTAASTCPSLGVEPQRCQLVFDVSAAESPTRVLVMRRGDDQATWRIDGTAVASPTG
jgi:hypothetical protein